MNNSNNQEEMNPNIKKEVERDQGMYICAIETLYIYINMRKRGSGREKESQWELNVIEYNEKWQSLFVVRVVCICIVERPSIFMMIEKKRKKITRYLFSNRCRYIMHRVIFPPPPSPCILRIISASDLIRCEPFKREDNSPL